MRFKSPPAGEFQAFAVSGTNTISFAIQTSADARPGLLGFAVRRSDPVEEADQQPRRLDGFKVFRSILPEPGPDTRVTTWDHPIQSFVWDDFTGKPDRLYEYWFHPLYGTPTDLDRSTEPVRIRVKTEKLFSEEEHDVFFNRGVASSQAYQRKFGNRKPDQLPDAEEEKALKWLSRDLGDAMVRFIAAAKPGDTLLCCFYEFRHRPVAEALRDALQANVDVKIIIDAKVNERTDKKGVFYPSFPRTENLAMIAEVGLPAEAIIERDANPTNIQHNKFMVLLEGPQKKPTAVWTGSTNVSLGGITGQTNVGHWVRNCETALAFKTYWELLEENLGSTKDEDNSTRRTSKAALRKRVEHLGEVPDSFDTIPPGITPVFSPRTGLDVLNLYVDLVDTAKTFAGVTLAFGVNDLFKEQLGDNTGNSGLVFMLLEKKDKPRGGTKPFVVINHTNNVYKAWGAYINDPVYQWARETNARALGLNRHVSYIHSKFLLRDPLSADPIVLTGSANFSAASTNGNDENMLLIRGNRRVADIYFTEFNRLFNHYYYRAVAEDRRDQPAADRIANLFLDETGGWVGKYAPGSLRAKRVGVFTAMAGFDELP